MKQTLDIIKPAESVTLYGLFLERLKRSSADPAYSYLDISTKKWITLTWRDMGMMVGRWISMFEGELLQRGDGVGTAGYGERVAVWSRNCVEWISADLASHALGFVVVPLYFDDRAENVSYIIQDSDARILMLEDRDQYEELKKVSGFPWNLKTIISISHDEVKEEGILRNITTALPEKGCLKKELLDGKKLATIVYTSGTTGNPKGVMLSHSNILNNAYNGLLTVPIYKEDKFFSFLPLSHTFERTVGYYLSMSAGSHVTFSRSKHKIAEDVITVAPTIMLSVPRFFERIYSAIKEKVEASSPVKKFLFNLTLKTGWKRFKHSQGVEGWSPLLLLWPLLDKVVASKVRQKLGGRLRITISGGAALSYDVAKLFLSLGINIIQGYGLTETSPIVSVNAVEDNDPLTIGGPINDVEIKIGENDELLVRGHGVMLGYWNNEKATKDIIDDDGWLHTGDKAEVSNGHIKIKGRIKEIIVLANGEKVPPADIENALESDTLIDQAMVAGEGKPYITAFVVISKDSLAKISKDLKIDETKALASKELENFFVVKIDKLMKRFPGYAKVHRCAVYTEPWTVEEGLITPTLKLKRRKILEKYSADFARLYEGH